VNARAFLRVACLLGLLVVSATTARAEAVVVVAARSPIASLSAAEMADIFLGRLTRLPDGTRAVPLDLPEGSPLRDEFYERIARMSPVQVKAYWSKLIFTGRGRPPRSLDTDEAVLRVVRENPSAIGYIDRRIADASVRILN